MKNIEQNRVALFGDNNWLTLSFHNEIIYDLRCKDTESFRYTQKNRRKFTFSAIFLCLDFVGLSKKLYSLTTNSRASPVPLYGYRVASN